LAEVKPRPVCEWADGRNDGELNLCSLLSKTGRILSLCCNSEAFLQDWLFRIGADC
jgi:hypothetical protein